MYEENVQNMDEEKLKEYLLDAQEYNAALLDTRIALIDPFDAEFNKLYKDTPYSNLLNYDSQGIMGFLEIPAIKVKLPIYHGTSPAVLQKGVGHLEGSSLPVGGESTHSILTGHTGLNKAKLFTDLTSVQKGDMFFVSVLGRKMAYVVDNINVVLPDDTTGRDVCPRITAPFAMFSVDAPTYKQASGCRGKRLCNTHHLYALRCKRPPAFSQGRKD